MYQKTVICFFTEAKYIFWYLNYGDMLVTAYVDNYEVINDDNMGDMLASIPGWLQDLAELLTSKSLITLQ